MNANENKKGESLAAPAQLSSDRVPLPYSIEISKSLLEAGSLPFVSYQKDRPQALAMNIFYLPVVSVREQIESYLNTRLLFFTNWDPAGEAHITVVTRPEWEQYFSPHIERKELDIWAQEERIQKSKFSIDGLGSFAKFVSGQQPDSTFFLTVQSKDLIRVRETFLKRLELKTKKKSDFNPSHYFPHITVGFTKTDFHESDGVIKDKAHSRDPRFLIKWTT